MERDAAVARLARVPCAAAGGGAVTRHLGKRRELGRGRLSWPRGASRPQPPLRARRPRPAGSPPARSCPSPVPARSPDFRQRHSRSRHCCAAEVSRGVAHGGSWYHRDSEERGARPRGGAGPGSGPRLSSPGGCAVPHAVPLCVLVTPRHPRIRPGPTLAARKELQREEKGVKMRIKRT